MILALPCISSGPGSSAAASFLPLAPSDDITMMARSITPIPPSQLEVAFQSKIPLDIRLGSITHELLVVQDATDSNIASTTVKPCPAKMYGKIPPVITVSQHTSTTK